MAIASVMETKTTTGAWAKATRYSRRLIPTCHVTAGRNGKRRIFKRDRLNHASPNSAQTEAVMAGALQVQLAGDAWYFGKKHEKPTIGDAVRPVEIEDIARANKLLYAASLLGMIVFCGIRIAVWFGIKMEL